MHELCWYTDYSGSQNLKDKFKYSLEHHGHRTLRKRSGNTKVVEVESNGSGYTYETISNTFFIGDYTFNMYYKEVNESKIRIKVYCVENPNYNDISELNVKHIPSLESACRALARRIEKVDSQRQGVIEKGKTFKPSSVVLDEVTDIQIEESTGSLQDRFTAITALTSEITTNINSQMSLSDTKELAKAFLDAKQSIEDVSVTSTGVSTFASKMLAKLPFSSKISTAVKTSLSESKSVQSNIDYLFGLIHEKYEHLVKVGEDLQKSKSQFSAQIVKLDELLIESTEDLDTYENKADIPMAKVALNTRIKATIEKHRLKLQKVDGAILGIQATIAKLGSELPAQKSDLEDEMAIGGVLASVDDYQEMYKQITELVSGVTKQTAEKTHAVIENLMDLQINDTHTTIYIQDQVQRGEKFAKMLATKSEALANKVTRDAKFISEVASGTPVIEARDKYKLL